jgi:transcription elongation factor GreA
MSKVPITARGAELLREEVQRLKRVERPAVVQAIAEARAHGDLKENAEYHAAKDQQGLLEARIRDIEFKLSHAHVIDVAKLNQDGRVVFGVTVIVIDEDDEDGEEISYQIVGEDEADIREGRISFTSPIARALIGREEGDSVTVAAPGGERTVEIVEVRYE